MVFHSLMQDWGELMLLSYSLTQSFMCRPSECLFGYNRQASGTRYQKENTQYFKT
jgi:hypothetical protein